MLVAGELDRLRVVLASASPRRRELLGLLGLRLEVIPSAFEEDLDKAAFPGAAGYAIETATHKAIEVAGRTFGAAGPADLVIGADTVVEDPSGAVLEKPADRAEAVRMLAGLSGRKHRVHTGVCLVFPKVADPKLGKQPYVRQLSETTVVEFDALPQEVIEAYVDTGDPMDKAGGYGIQGAAGSFVKGIEGCYFNVVG